MKRANKNKVIMTEKVCVVNAPQPTVSSKDSMGRSSLLHKLCKMELIWQLYPG